MNKSYKGFILWTIIYTAGFIPMIAVTNSENGETVTKFILLYTTAMLTLLAYIIYKTDSIYWYNGVSFEEAEAAGYERRTEYTYKHLQLFGNFTVLYTLFTAASIYMEINVFIDTLVFTIGLIVTAILTIRIKL
jgi:hypothetical protein